MANAGQERTIPSGGEMTTPHGISLLRLVAQRVVGPPCASPVEAVRLLAATQAQDLPGALRSVALRTLSRDRGEVRDALAAGQVVRSWPMRGTLHLVVAEDLPWMLELMTARPLAAAARRRTDLGLTDADVARAHAVVVDALTGGHAMSRAEILTRWEEAGQATSGGRGYHLLAHLAQIGVLCLGPMQETEQLFVLLREWVREPRVLDREAALAEVAARYLTGHGPATAADLARWTGLPMGDVRAGIASAADRLATLELAGVTHYLDPAVPDLLAEHRAAARRTLLLPGFDEMVLGYADRTVLVPAAHAQRIVPGGNGVFRSTVVHDGVAVGTWQEKTGGRGGGTATTATSRASARRVEVDWFAEPDGVPPARAAKALPSLAAALP